MRKAGEKRKRDDDPPDENEYYNGPRSPTPDAFYLGSTQSPSPIAQTWNYRWRGTEEPQSVLALYSDKNVYEITFSGPGGTILSGTIGGGFLEDCTFTVKKIAMGGQSIDIGKKWAEHNESAHHSANRRRW
jgi:hypothetical protein